MESEHESSHLGHRLLDVPMVTKDNNDNLESMVCASHYPLKVKITLNSLREGYSILK